MAEECNQKLALLGNDTLRSIARWKVEGDTNAEIAVKLDCLERTVERKPRHHSRPLGESVMISCRVRQVFGH